uniref:Uncharacterized protein n=1 Tax=Onchocerca volvulus TaxID=6282 RepID=A0A8R1XNZ5_ONCVO
MANIRIKHNYIYYDTINGRIAFLSFQPQNALEDNLGDVRNTNNLRKKSTEYMINLAENLLCIQVK